VIGAAVVGVRLEGLAHVIGDEDRDATGPAVAAGRLEDGREIGLARHVLDGVVNEDRVELPVEAHSAHVVLDVLTLGIEAARNVQHVVGEIDQREAEVLLQVRGDVAAAAEARARSRRGGPRSSTRAQ
jgi:hypothetical protein